MSKTIPAPSENATQVSAITPALVTKKKVAKITKQKPGHGSKRYTEAERNVILDKKKAGISFTALKDEYGVAPKTIIKWLKKAKASDSAPKVKVIAASTSKAVAVTNDRADVFLMLTQAVKRQEVYLNQLKLALAALTG